MKKLLSAVLALVMVLATASMLIPTAWAEPAPYVPTPRPEDSWVYYEQDFEGPELAGLEDAALAEAIGWTAPNETQTMLLQDGKLRFVSEYGTSRTAAYNTTLIAEADERMMGNMTVIEYDLKYQRRAASTQDANNDVTVNGGQKVVAADGQDGAMLVSVTMGNNSGKIFATRFPVKGTINRRAFNGNGKNISGNTLALAMKNSVDLLGNIPESQTSYTLEVGGSTSRFDVDYHVKAVYDPIAGMYYLMLNGIVVAKVSADDNYSGSIRFLAEHIISQYVLTIENSADVLIDNIQIYGCSSTPALVISEVSPNGVGVNEAGTIKMGGYQWIELYNPTGTPVNVYDYALHVNNAPVDTNANSVDDDSTFGQNTDVTTGRGSTLGYLKAGAQTFTLSEGTSTFTNPAYADGVLQPGEAAIVILPDALHGANMALDQEQITKEFVKLGMPADTAIFVCDNYNDYPMVLSSEGTMTLGLMEVNNPGTNEVVGKYVGENDECLMYLESYLLLTSDNENDTTLYEGFALTTGYVPLNTVMSGARKSVEISYWGFDTAGSSSKMGFMKVNANRGREGIDGEEAFVTPGFVNIDLRPSVAVSVYSQATGATTTEYGVFMTEWALENPEQSGYEFLGYQVAGANEYVDKVYMSKNGLQIVAAYKRVAPEFIGYQVSEMNEGKYTVRLLAGLVNSDVDAVGFKYSYSYLNENGRNVVVEEEIYRCEYVYTAVTVAGDTVQATDLGYEYFFALHVNNIPEVVDAVDFEVTAFVIKDKFQTAPVCDAEYLVQVSAPVTGGNA